MRAKIMKTTGTTENNSMSFTRASSNESSENIIAHLGKGETSEPNVEIIVATQQKVWQHASATTGCIGRSSRYISQPACSIYGTQNTRSRFRRLSQAAGQHSNSYVPTAYDRSRAAML